MFELAEILRQEGLAVTETAGWRTRAASGAYVPEGICNHHTANRQPGDAPSLNLVINGRAATDRYPAVPGPLCNILLGRSGRCYVIAAGKANDTGTGSSVVLKEVRANVAPSGDARVRGLANDLNGNPYFYDVEVENDGVGEPYPDVQLKALVKVNAAILKAKAWHPNRCIQHREWTSRKIDMSWRGDLRGIVAAYLRGAGPQPMPPRVEEEDVFVRADNGPSVWYVSGGRRYPVPSPRDMEQVGGFGIVKVLSPDHFLLKLPVGSPAEDSKVTMDFIARTDQKLDKIIANASAGGGLTQADRDLIASLRQTLLDSPLNPNK